MLRRLLVLLLGAVSLSAHADSVTILVDASFSMSLPAEPGHGDAAPTVSRLEVVNRKLLDFMATLPAETRYALLVAEHGDTVELRLPYPARSDQVARAMGDVVPWGAIDLTRAITNAGSVAASIADSNTETSENRNATLVVLTDAEDLSALTGAHPPELPDGVRLRLMQPLLSSVSRLSSRLAPLEQSTSVAPMRPTVDAPRPAEDETVTDERAIDVRATDTPPTYAQGPERSLLVHWAGVARWALLAGAILGLGAVFKAHRRHRRRLNRTIAHNSRPPSVKIEARGPGARGEGCIDSYPTTVDGSYLAGWNAALGAADGSFTLSFADGVLSLSAPDLVKINGVQRTDQELRGGEQVRLGAVRLIVREIETVKPVRPPRPSHRRYALAPAASALAAGIAFVLASGASEQQPLDTFSSEASAVKTSDATTTELPEAREPAKPRAEALAFSGAVSPVEMPSLRLPEIVAPADPLPTVDLDYLVIHAHPDDEAIDFGALIARMSASGLRGGVLLLTDGNAGRDQFPWRQTGERYPAYDLSDSELAAIRVREAREAIGWLGGEYYFRLGLHNHPYNSLTEVITSFDVLERWGGRAALATRIADTIVALNPEVLLTPDGPAATVEHFEHEATGIVVRDALERLDATGRNPVDVHLVSVDPLQVDLYTAAGDLALRRISPWEPDSESAVPRLRQALALRAHRTQRDATVIALETRLSLLWDYYVVYSRTDHPVLSFPWRRVDR